MRNHLPKRARSLARESESESHSVVFNSLWVHAILQARILESVAFPFARGSSQPRDRTQVSCIAGGFFTSWATREEQEYWSGWFPLSSRSSWPRNRTGVSLRCRQILYQLSYQGSPGRDLLNRSDQILLLNSKAAKTPELSVIPHPVLPSAHLASMKLRSGFKTRDTVIKTGPIHVSSTSIRSGHQYPVTEDPAVVHPTWCMNQETETGIVFGYLEPHLPSPYLPHVHGPLHFILRREGSWGQCPSFILRTNLSGLSPLFSLRAASLYLHVPSVDNSLNAPSSNSQSHLSVQLSWDLKLHIQLHAPPILCSTRFLNLCHVLNQPSTCLPNCEFSLLCRFCKQWWQDKLEKKKINSSSCVVLCNLQCILQLDLTGDS